MAHRFIPGRINTFDVKSSRTIRWDRSPACMELFRIKIQEDPFFRAQMMENFVFWRFFLDKPEMQDLHGFLLADLRKMPTDVIFRNHHIMREVFDATAYDDLLMHHKCNVLDLLKQKTGSAHITWRLAKFHKFSPDYTSRKFYMKYINENGNDDSIVEWIVANGSEIGPDQIKYLNSLTFTNLIDMVINNERFEVFFNKVARSMPFNELFKGSMQFLSGKIQTIAEKPFMVSFIAYLVINREKINHRYHNQVNRWMRMAFPDLQN